MSTHTHTDTKRSRAFRLSTTPRAHRACSLHKEDHRRAGFGILRILEAPARGPSTQMRGPGETPRGTLRGAPPGGICRTPRGSPGRAAGPCRLHCRVTRNLCNLQNHSPSMCLLMLLDKSPALVSPIRPEPVERGLWQKEDMGEK